MQKFCSEKAEKYLLSLENNRKEINDYVSYWADIKPKSAEMHYRMFLFAFMSVHTGWRANVRGYEALDRLLEESGGFMPGIESDGLPNDPLWDELVKCKAGLQKRRHKGIARFSHDFRKDPEWFFRRKRESLKACRDRLCDSLYGLGMAKTSFALEMIHPENKEVVCLDTHMIQLYAVTENGKPVKGSINDKLYRAIESHWCRTCKKVNVPSPIARHIWWDRKQQQSSTDYWSYVFRGRNERLAVSDR